VRVVLSVRPANFTGGSGTVLSFKALQMLGSAVDDDPTGQYIFSNVDTFADDGRAVLRRLSRL
jgi:hypothetical protein